MSEFISNVNGASFYMPPKISPLSIRKYAVGINTSNTVLRELENGSFFVMSRDIDDNNSKDTIYYVYDNIGDYQVHSINIKTGAMDGFIIDGGEWS